LLVKLLVTGLVVVKIKLIKTAGSMPSHSITSIPSAATSSAASRMQPTHVFISMIGSDSEEDTVHQPPKRLPLL